jgi:hypothetical protein
MTWTSPATQAVGTLITASMYNNQLIGNIAHIGAMLRGATALSVLPAGAQLSVAIGSYTGDGGATKAITGLEFQPRAVDIYAKTDGPAFGRFGTKTDQDGTNALISSNQYETDHIISLDSGGFTVGDGTASTNGNTMNINAVVYVYKAWG